MIDEEATFEKFGYYSTDLTPESHKKVVAVCDDCGKARISPKHGYHARCHSCANKGERSCAWKGGVIKQICKNCGVGFPAKPSNIKIGKAKFCSPKCAAEWQSKHRSGKNHPSWKGGLVMRTCEECGIEFPVKPSEIKNGNGKFCTRKCMGKWYSKYRRGENSPSWQGGISFEPYCHKFNNEFKEYIRDKFGRVCFYVQKPKRKTENDFPYITSTTTKAAVVMAI